MSQVAVLMTACAALISAVAWPLLVIFLLSIFRAEIKTIVSKVSVAFDRMQSIKIGLLEFGLKELADDESQVKGDPGRVTIKQAQAAADLSIKARLIDDSQLIALMDRLAIEYDTIRNTLKSSPERTRQMTRIVIQMRALGPSISSIINRYMKANSAGMRLAAIAMMQMNPDQVDLGWLKTRFENETPFIFYHAALALQNAAGTENRQRQAAVIEIAKECLSLISKFAGTPDSNTIQVLQTTIEQTPA